MANFSVTLIYLLGAVCAADVPPEVLQGIVQTESGFKPFAIGVNRSSVSIRQPQNLDEAIETATLLYKQGINFDAGLAQINSANFKRLNLTPASVFDPCRNLQASQAVFRENYEMARNKGHEPGKATLMALSAYNTGNLTRGFRNGYVQKVVTNSEKLKAHISPFLQMLSSTMLSVAGKGKSVVRRAVTSFTRDDLERSVPVRLQVIPQPALRLSKKRPLKVKKLNLADVGDSWVIKVGDHNAPINSVN